MTHRTQTHGLFGQRRAGNVREPALTHLPAAPRPPGLLLADIDIVASSGPSPVWSELTLTAPASYKSGPITMAVRSRLFSQSQPQSAARKGEEAPKPLPCFHSNYCCSCPPLCLANLVYSHSTFPQFFIQARGEPPRLRKLSTQG